MKKFLLLFAALLTLSVAASAQNPDGIPCFVDGDWAYFVNPDVEHEVTVIQYQGEGREEATELTIPSYATYNGSRYFVTALGESLFSWFNNEGNEEYTHWWSHDAFTKLEKISIPNTVTNIGISAFHGCSGLTSVTIPNSVTEIKSYAFYGCKGLTSVTIPNSVTEIREYVFYDCTGLTSVTIPSSVTEIGLSAFEGCTGLTSVIIPNSLTYIGGQAFSGCTGLPEFVVEDGNAQYSAVDGVLYNSKQTVLIAYPGGKEGAFEIPGSVTQIEWYAFSGCTGLTFVNIPNSVTYIGGDAFSDCTGLTSVTIPNSVTSIGGSAFSGCTSLTSVTIPNSVTTIGGWAFSGCTGLTSVTIPNSVTEIGVRAFRGCTALETIYALPATPPACKSDTFENVPKTAVVYIPKGSFKAYFVETGWDHFTDFREMGALDITLSESSISIEEGKTATLTATMTKDSDVTVESESWTSSNPEVATVDGDGLVTAVGAGSATISYTVVDGYGVPHSESCEVMVSAMTGIEGITAEGDDAPAEYFTLSGVRVNGEALTPGLYIKRRGGKAVKVLVK